MRLPKLYTADRRALFLFLLGNGLVQGALAVASAWLVMRLFDRLGVADERSLVMFLALMASVAISALLRRQERIDAEKLGQQYVRSVRRRLYSRLLRSNPRDISKRRKGALLLKFVGDLSAVRRWISLGLARLVVAGVSVAVAFAALTWLYWPFALGLAATLCIAAGWILRQSGSLRSAIEAARRCHANLSANVTEKLNNLATVQVFGQARRERRFMRRQSDRLLQASVVKAAKIGSLRAVMDATVGASIVAVLGIAFFAPPQDLSAGMLVAVVSIIGFLTPPLRDLGRAQEYWLAAQVARDNLRAISRQSTQLRERRTGELLVVSNGSIRFEHVSISGALRDISVTAAGLGRIAVLGPNGSGKSTLLGLVGRMFDPGKGRILIDEQDISRVRLSSLRRQVAQVSAEVPLIRGSLEKNLCYGAGEVTPDFLRQVLADCELDDFLAGFPGGLKGRIAENGANLSQGERVRVALARALLVRPKILLLDEADANLDAQAVKALDRVIRDFSGTLLMATHRRSALEVCDSFWQLRDGRLEKVGRPTDALAESRQVIRIRDTEQAGRLTPRVGKACRREGAC